jgi:hypothetical protein
MPLSGSADLLRNTIATFLSNGKKSYVCSSISDGYRLKASIESFYPQIHFALTSAPIPADALFDRHVLIQHHLRMICASHCSKLSQDSP